MGQTWSCCCLCCCRDELVDLARICVLPTGVEFYSSGFDSNDVSTFPRSYPIVLTDLPTTHKRNRWKPSDIGELVHFLDAFVCAVVVVFIVMLVPETKGRTLEEIQASMN